MSLWTTRGRGVDATWRALHTPTDALTWTAPRYPDTGLANARCGGIELPIASPSRATTLLLTVVREAMEQAGLTDGRRVGLVVGTSSGDIGEPWEQWHDAHQRGVNTGAEPSRTGPTSAVAAQLGLGGPVATVALACISGTAAFAVAVGWLEDGACDAVVVAGVDALSLFVHAGFSGLGALSKALPRPFTAERDGLLLGEGAAALVLEAPRPGLRSLGTVLGVGLGSDAVHMTAPDREGRGAARGMAAALDDAGCSAAQVDVVSLHGTGTVFNDAMEAQAVRAVFGDRQITLQAVKRAIGHTLGAAGAIEAVLGVHTLRTGEHPPFPDALAPDCGFLRQPPPPSAPQRVLSLSSAFGGANASVLLGAPGQRRRGRGPIDVERIGASEAHVQHDDEWRTVWPDAPERFWRLDAYTRIALLATHRLVQRVGPLPSACGVVLSTQLGCRDADLRYQRTIEARGAARASRRDFTYTIPGAPAAELSIAYGLQGPVLVLLGPQEPAFQDALRMLRWGRASSLLVLHCDAPGEGAPAHATAGLVRALP